MPAFGRDPLYAVTSTFVESISDELFDVCGSAPLQGFLLQRDTLVWIFVQDLAVAILVHQCDQHQLVILPAEKQKRMGVQGENG